LGSEASDRDGNHTTLTDLRWLTVIFYYTLTTIHLLLLSVTSKNRLLLWGYLPSIIIFWIANGFINVDQGFGIERVHDFWFVVTSPGILKIWWYCLAGAISFMFVFNIKVTTKLLWSFCTLMEKVNKYYTKDYQKHMFFTQLYGKKKHMSELLRYYFQEISTVDPIIERMRNPDAGKQKQIQIAKLPPRIQCLEMESRYLVYRTSIEDQSFEPSVWFFGIIYAALVIPISWCNDTILHHKNSQDETFVTNYQSYLIFCFVLFEAITLVSPIVLKLAKAYNGNNIKDHVFVTLNILGVLILISGHQDDFYFVWLCFLFSMFFIKYSMYMILLTMLMYLICFAFKINFAHQEFQIYTDDLGDGTEKPFLRIMIVAS
jgi:hypothetical protein